jgi:quercetin dioxygenase-like cupin family protein
MPAKTYNAGEALIVPAETVHAVRNVGEGNGAELATYVIEKGKPFIVLAEAERHRKRGGERRADRACRS